MKSHRNSGVEILIAEDSPTQRAQLEYLLQANGYAVVAAANGKQALDAARQRRPALIISDVLMPVLDGYGFCKAIKSDEKLKSIPLILVTTLSDPQDVIRGLECGADNFIRKPYEAHYLLSRIDYLLMNLELRKNQKMQMGVEIDLGGEKHFITAERQQILDLLISTYEQAVHINEELKAREKDLAHSNQVLNGLYRIAEGLNGAHSQQEVAETALDRALELPGVHSGWIFLREGESGYRLAAARNLPPALAASIAQENDCACRRWLLSGELSTVTNITECERLANSSNDPHGLRYHASIPLWLDKRTLGLMNLAGPQPGLFDDDALKVLHGVGNHVAVALERARLHGHMESLVEQRTAALTAEIAERKRAEARVMRLNRVHAVLSGINTTIVRVRDRQELFDEACRIAVEHGGFRLAWIGLLNADETGVEPLANAGFDAGYLDKIRLTVKEDAADPCMLIMQTLKKKTPVICNDVETDMRMASWREEALQRDFRSIAVFPLLVGDRVVGAFALYAAEPGFFDDEEMRLLVEMAGDISFAMDHLLKEARLDYLAYYDAVTGLPNRALFWDRVEQRIGTARHDRKAFAVIMLDLERFSTINETLGRQAGDELLRQFAQYLQSSVAETDILARLAADCFGIAMQRTDNSADIAHSLEQILADIRSRVFVAGGTELRVAARAGVAAFPADGQDIESLYRNAEAALKKAKLSKDAYQFYIPAFNARAAETLTLENKLRRALEQAQFVLHYQPKVNLDTGQIHGLEALIRWNDPDAGLVQPLKFIPLLEETGMILEVGRWALQQAMADAGQWRAQGLLPPRIAVNVSSIQLQQKDFVATVERVLSDAGHSAGGLELEITESLIMQDIEANIQKLRAVKAMGVKVAVDDFGTGYSSLSYLTRLPINALKIDRAFIINMANKADDLSIVETIISLGHSLKLTVIAEGVETDEQVNLLRRLKCDEIQGYLFSPAVTAEQIGQFLGQNKSLSARAPG